MHASRKFEVSKYSWYSSRICSIEKNRKVYIHCCDSIIQGNYIYRVKFFKKYSFSFNYSKSSLIIEWMNRVDNFLSQIFKKIRQFFVMYYPFNHSGHVDANEAENKSSKRILSRSTDPLITLVNNPPNSNCWMARIVVSSDTEGLFSNMKIGTVPI